MSKGFTIFLGIAEFAGGLGMAVSVQAQVAAMGFILIMLGAIQKKIFEWHLPFGPTTAAAFGGPACPAFFDHGEIAALTSAPNPPE